MLGRTPGQESEPVELERLAVDPGRNTDFTVKAPHRSLGVVERYEAALTGMGWKARKPGSETEPGQRKWISPGPVGPTDAYEAAWEDPKTGRVAVLNVWHIGGKEGVQHGSFQIMDRSQLVQ